MIADFPSWLSNVLIIAQLWDLAWKGVGLWKSSKKNHLAWFVAMLIFNTIGILPIIYLAWFEKKGIKEAEEVKVKKKKR
jgi:hypothetical protein